MPQQLYTPDESYVPSCMPSRVLLGAPCSCRIVARSCDLARTVVAFGSEIRGGISCSKNMRCRMQPLLFHCIGLPRASLQRRCGGCTPPATPARRAYSKKPIRTPTRGQHSMRGTPHKLAKGKAWVRRSTIHFKNTHAFVLPRTDPSPISLLPPRIPWGWLQVSSCCATAAGQRTHVPRSRCPAFPNHEQRNRAAANGKRPQKRG